MFAAKAWVFRSRRWVHDLTGERQRWPVLSEDPEVWHTGPVSRTRLWWEEEAREQVLEAGKVRNLQVACERLNGVVIEAGGVFSFWRQLGRASARHGFVQGRMLQGGCIIPAVGGGLCQLSNALYELALRSGCEIIERHAHSVRMRHTPLQDATVAWNYIDLRFRMPCRTRISTTVTDRELVVEFQTLSPSLASQAAPFSLIEAGDVEASHLRSCTSCGEVECFRHKELHR